MRPEYKRSDFGELVQGKYATTPPQFSEMVRLFLACIGEDQGLKFINQSESHSRSSRKPGDWTYELDNANQITLRYWLSEFESIEEQVSSPTCITSSKERSDLQNLLVNHVQALQARVEKLER